MITGKRSRAVLLLCLAAAALSCAGSRLRGQADDTDGVIAKARANGAMKCAPVELAKAEAHNDFARQEISDGDYSRAEQEADEAQINAKAAFEKSPPEKCTEKPVVAQKDGDADGDGIKDKLDECPKIAEDFDGFEDSDGCPEPDNDADGINDVDDKCPMIPEDRDGFEDADGCPDPDNDKDGLVDKIDQCPDQAEDPDGFEDDDGCPDCDNDKDGVPECPVAKDKCPMEPGEPSDGCPKKYVNIVVTKDKIELKQTVFFDTRKATIKPVSFGLLDEVAQALKDNATIRVRIEGHTDSQGPDAFNLKLSKNRAASVKAYLVGKGIDAERMDPQGFGETVPIADNRTDNGRSQNRRVEFFITSR
jgi:OmpA-OmpF porin, OOP family